MQLNMLIEDGINCHLKDEHIVTIDPFLSPAVGGIKLMVAEPQVERAKQILEDAEKAWLQTVACPACGQQTLEKIISTKEFHSIWGKLKSMLANGQEKEIKKYYHCRNCNHDFKELSLGV